MPSNKPQQHIKQELPPVNDNILQLKRVNFIKDIPIFLNFMNRIDSGEYELTIKTPPGSGVSFLFIHNVIAKKTCVVPLTSVASFELS